MSNERKPRLSGHFRIATAAAALLLGAGPGAAHNIQQVGVTAVYPGWYMDQRVECVGANQGARLANDIEWVATDPREHNGQTAYPHHGKNQTMPVFFIGEFDPDHGQVHLPYIGPHDHVVPAQPGDEGYSPHVAEYLVLLGPNAVPGVNVEFAFSFLDFSAFGGPAIPFLPLVYAADVGDGMELLTSHERLYKAIDLGLIVTVFDGFTAICSAVDTNVGGEGTGDGHPG